jgi:hypothetical protein
MSVEKAASNLTKVGSCPTAASGGTDFAAPWRRGRPGWQKFIFLELYLSRIVN